MCVTTLAACAPSPSPADAQALATALSAVRVVADRPTVAGYDRDLFGGWAPSGACDARQVAVVTLFGAGDGPCEPAPGTARCAYTGLDLTADAVEVDHVYPLAAAWDMGAARWPAARRRAFANDPANLVPVDPEANRTKSDLTPAEWLPGRGDLACAYVARYAAVAARWGLPATVEDVAAMAGACGIRIIR